MVLPLLLSAAAASAAVFGAKEGVEAISKTSQAKQIQTSNQRLHRQARANFDQALTTTASTLETLGQQRLNAWNHRLVRLAQLDEKLQDLELTGQANVGDLQVSHLTPEALDKIKPFAWQEQEVGLGGAVALGTGVLAGAASYGGAMMLTSTSVGTKMSVLSGAAATKTTMAGVGMAGVGGGSLAAGSLGVAGGALVWGGVITAPMLAVGGLMLHGKAKHNLAQTTADAAKLAEAVEAMESGIALLEAIEQAAQLFQNSITGIGSLLDEALDELVALLELAKSDEQACSPKQRHRSFYLAVQLTQMLKLLLETPLLTTEGALQVNCYSVIERAKAFEQQLTLSSN